MQLDSLRGRGSARPVRFARALAAVAVALATCGCGGNGSGPPSGLRSLTVVPNGDPSISSDGDGRTLVIASFVARALDTGVLRTLTVGETVTEFFLDGVKVSGESVLNRDEIGGDLFYSLVLDASYSMQVDHDAPAFAPMLAAARASVEEVAREWQQRGTNAQVRFDWLWFDDFIHYPDDKTPDNIAQIPTPSSGENDTRLFGAVDFMIHRHVEAAAGGFAVRPQDRHVMVLFTDGNDNRSYFVTQRIEERLQDPFPHLRHRPGVPTDDHRVLIERIAARQQAGQLPPMTVHSIALGTALAEEPLVALAESHGGAFVRNPSSRKLATLFEAITREVVSIQTIGLKLPLRAGRYTLVVRVRAGNQPELFADFPIEFDAQP